ncbi:MAG: DNA cytosine methyltransferase [Kiritimatiellae bacterium]|nr:DNA cytosine methyltransferase [Kiritimatiellia bacterium]
MIVFVDLYCGCGGFTTGAHEAFHELGLPYREIAINHWLRAIETMRANHPDVLALKMDIEAATSKDIGVKVIDLLHASPSCTHFSRAKGDKPRDDQLRSQPNEIWKFVDNIHVRRITIENVPEFVNWGPLTTDGRPIKRKMGDCFRAWLQQFTARGYTYEWRILNCADYGDATSRKRFFLQAVKHGCGKIKWPEPTHEENPQPDLFGRNLRPWRGVCECLDYSDTGRSIFGRKNPLAKNTLCRIAVGLRKYCGIDFQVDMLGAGGDDESRVLPLSAPLRTQHTSNRTMVVRPFLVKLNNHATVEDTKDPLTTVTTSGNHHALCQPFIVRLRNNQDCADIGKPLSAISCSGAHHELCTPIIIEHMNNGRARSVKEPIGVQTTHDRFSMVTPYLITEQTNNAPRGIDKPLRAQTTVRKDYLCTPLVLWQQGGAACRPIDKPCPTIATKGAICIATPMIIDMSRPGGRDSGHVRSADEPIQTITSCDAIQLGLPMLEDGRLLDIRIRMLKPSELAAAHSFPRGYKLSGSRADQVKQIGNSIPVQTAKAIVKAIFGKEQ